MHRICYSPKQCSHFQQNKLLDLYYQFSQQLFNHDVRFDTERDRKVSAKHDSKQMPDLAF